MLRNARHTKIISSRENETQEELCAALAEEGYTVTQATVSRDIKELRLFKVKGSEKRFRYASAQEPEEAISDKMHSLFRTCVEDIRPVGNLLVVRTLNGNGSNAGVVIDRLSYHEIVGTVSGDDTVLIICENSADAHSVCTKLESLLKA